MKIVFALALVLCTTGCSAVRRLVAPPNYIRAAFFAGNFCGDSSDVMVRVGNLCVDVYESSVWVVRNGVEEQAVPPYPCSPTGADCHDLDKALIARSRPGVLPAADVTWFQAQCACLNAGKRLPTDAEWQGVALGTNDDSARCNLTTAGPRQTGIPGAGGPCVSVYGIHDAVGNLAEWTASSLQDNDDNDSPTVQSTSEYGSDEVLGIDEARPEGRRFWAIQVRGGTFDSGTGGGVYALDATAGPAHRSPRVGFRCVR
jgi:Sulfatase-modifying factor enzyme 1